MMIERHLPKRWAIVRYKVRDREHFDRLLTSYKPISHNTESWRLSQTPIKSLVDGKHILVKTYDDEEYICLKDAQGLSPVMIQQLPEIVENGRLIHNAEVEIIFTNGEDYAI